MPKTVILGTARTPFGKMGGALASKDATDLGGHAIENALERAEVKPDEVQHVVFGQVLQAGQGQVPSRQAQIKGGIPKEVSSETVNKVCASGIRAAGIVDQAVRAGDLDVAVAGGMESMSGAPYMLPKARFGYRMGDAKMLDAMVHDGLTNPFSGKQMFVEATEVGDELEITRADMDKFALQSHDRAIAATDDGRLAEEIAPVTISSKKGDTVVEVDEPPRRGSSLEALAKLPGLTGKDGSHTAGNAPGVNDGAGALVLSSDEWAKANDKTVLATIIGQAAVADDFPYLARTPANATKKALDQAGLSIDDIDLFEINEAFASVAINSLRMLGVEED
jgi:acetyl-CoA C-acetyltransferase